AAAASRLYVDAINKLARQAQQGTWGGCSDVGAALMKIVEVYKEIQDQQMNILKAFYVDLLVPLETNLEKDTKVVQSEQKRFLQQHKQRAETYSKAAAMMKKQRKKSRSSTKTGLAMDKELKNMQVLEEEKTKLDAFCEQSLKNAMTQERRRYGFVLERHCSLAKHYLSYHTQGVAVYQHNLEKWSEVAKTREFLPETVENIFSNRLRQISVWHDEDVYSSPRSPHFDDDGISISSQLRKTKSMDASCLDIRSIGDVGSPVTTLSRAKSEYNLNSSTHSLEQDETPTRRPKSMAVPPVPPPQWDTQLARALYAYLSSGENQLSFLEGDLIALIGERNKGWQFGENLRTQCSGWFPLAYTEVLDDSSLSPTHASSSGSGNANIGQHPMSPGGGGGSGSSPGNVNVNEPPTPRMFGDTLHLHRSSANAKQIRRAIGSNNIPPPALPAPVPTPSLPYHKTGMTQSQSTNFSSKTNTEATFQSPYSQTGIKSSASSFNFTTPSTGSYSTHPQPSRSDRPTAGAPLPLHLQSKGSKIGGPVGNVSLHSSNDSGFSNDPPPQPEIDYSDDDSIPGQTKLPARYVTPFHF
ncbi:PREDICTED: brain-specific angiogenesis inhibitor 1-associated protein 2-like, partial [Nicrophorus vespilloides]|uniref:Brain-specific angiogenesis inhibitor 1-associated protein 2-like n=1 Tax=Nicrophorus vespilloides TaxID=110193 RepID=A0ABM1M8S3_NICVS